MVKTGDGDDEYLKAPSDLVRQGPVCFRSSYKTVIRKHSLTIIRRKKYF